jgi:hypothetical protein
MKHFILNLPGALTLGALGLLPSADAQNLLATNAGFEANTAYYAPGWGWPQGSPDALPGWIITLDPTGDGCAGAANNQAPQDLEGTHFGYIYSGTGSAGVLETAPDCRAPVEKDITYTLWFLARGDASWSDSLATVSLVWYANQNNGTPVGDPTNLDLTLPAPLAPTDPMLPFHLTATAPSGAHYAGVRVTRPAYDYAPVILDDFVIMAEPTEVSLSIRKQGPQAVLSWPRSLKHKLELNSDLALPSGWHATNKPPKGVGATNYVDWPLAEPAHFFRLAASD